MAERYEVMHAGLTLDTKPGRARSTPVFLASSTQTAAFGRVGGQTLFNEALMTGLGGTLAHPPDRRKNVAEWHISVEQFTKFLGDDVDALARAANVRQVVDLGGTPVWAVFHYFDGPPQIQVDIEVAPDAMAPVAVGSLSHQVQGQLLNADGIWPMRGMVAAGIYELSVKTNDPAKKYFEYVTVEPPKYQQRVAFS